MLVESMLNAKEFFFKSDTFKLLNILAGFILKE